jgi:4-hydroxy-2-oxoheptanedioate aldolase
VVEILGLVGIDWVMLDCEHGSLSDESVELMAMAALASGITPIARPRANRPEYILRVLDAGCLGVQVPHVNTAEEAQAVVESVKYAPLGKRGIAAPRAAGYGALLGGRKEYIEWSNRETLVCVQMEEAEALRNLDEIIKVPNIDVFFIGPSDLSQSMGYADNPGHPEVVKAIEKGFEKILKAGKIGGISGNDEGLTRYAAKGVHYLYTHSNRYMGDGARKTLAAFGRK